MVISSGSVMIGARTSQAGSIQSIELRRNDSPILPGRQTPSGEIRARPPIAGVSNS
jgi:hypothetical protein